SFIKDVDLETSHLSEVNDLILTLTERKFQEQEKLRQNACTILSIIQRTKVQLIELRPTINDETDQKLKKIDDDLTTNYELFEQSLNNYKRVYGNISDDLDKMI
ncbi:unnamed protein product, partial [Rotaria sordida]